MARTQAYKSSEKELYDALSAKSVFLDQPIETIADSIAAIAEGIKKLRSGRLNDRALLILLSHATGIGQREIKQVLEGLESLGSTYLKPKRGSVFDNDTGPR